MRILLISSSARGHAIAEVLAHSPQHPEIFSLCTTRNPGIRRIAAAQEVVNIMDFPIVLAHAKRWRPAFAIIGPDDPIGAGLADLLEDEGIPCIAPRKHLARIESSKGFARELLKKYGIDASPHFRVFMRPDHSAIRSYIHDACAGEYVVKYDGLKGGKGVKISGEHLASIEEGVAYACSCIAQCGRVVIEEKLSGPEFSLMSFVSGKQVVHMPAVQDHKRAFDGDTGPNTGGMGSYSMPNHSMPFLAPSDLERAKEINQAVAEALYRECKPHPYPLPRPLSRCGRRGGYRGILYGGYMLTRSTGSRSGPEHSGPKAGQAPDGIRVIEFNARFGDPEALNVLPLLTSDFVDICQAIISGELTEDLVSFEKKATVCKYIVPRSYPGGSEEKGAPVALRGSQGVMVRCSGAEQRSHEPYTLLAPQGDTVFHIYYGDVAEDPDGSLHLGTSRALGIVGIGDTLREAESIAQDLCEQVKGPVRFRSDIGTSASLQKRIAAMGLRHSLPRRGRVRERGYDHCEMTKKL